MNRRRLVLALFSAVAVGVSGCAGTEPYSRTGVSAGVSFYDELSPYGTWFNYGPYGSAWIPLGVPIGWRPYTTGYWAYTDWGWMWISQDPWGALPYHYGRWTYDAFYGWIWVPDDVWAPAWVSWHYGDGWVGWAPLPPDVGWRTGAGLAISAVDLDRRIDPYSWCFVRSRDFTTRRIRTSVLPPSRNVTLLAATRNVTRYGIVDARPAERGLSPTLIERDLGRKIPKYRIVEPPSTAGAMDTRIRGRIIETSRAPISTQALERRVKETRREPARPSPGILAREEAERRRFEGRMRLERQALQREQERDLRQSPPGESRAQEMRRRHEAEQRAQQERELRERRMMEERERRLREMEQRPSQPGPGRGRGRGRGHGQTGSEDED